MLVVLAPVLAGAAAVALVISTAEDEYSITGLTSVRAAVVDTDARALGAAIDEFDAIVSDPELTGEIADAYPEVTFSPILVEQVGDAADVRLTMTASEPGAGEEILQLAARRGLIGIAQNGLRAAALSVQSAEERVDETSARVSTIEASAGVQDVLNAHRIRQSDLLALRNSFAQAIGNEPLRVELAELISAKEAELAEIGRVLAEYDVVRTQLDSSLQELAAAEFQVTLGNVNLAELRDSTVPRAVQTTQVSQVPDLLRAAVAAGAVGVAVVLALGVLLNRRRREERDDLAEVPPPATTRNGAVAEHDPVIDDDQMVGVR